MLALCPTLGRPQVLPSQSLTQIICPYSLTPLPILNFESLNQSKHYITKNYLLCPRTNYSVSIQALCKLTWIKPFHLDSGSADDFALEWS